MTTSPSSGLSPEAKEFVPLGQNPAISIPLYVDENTVASIYPSDQQPLMVQSIYPMMVTNSKVSADNIQFPEIEFHIQPSQQQQFHIDSCANIPPSSSLNGNSTSQIVLLPTVPTNSATAVTSTGYYSGPQIIYSTNESISGFYPVDYCEQALINFSIQQPPPPPQMTKSNRISYQQARPSSFRQQHGMNHSTYRPSFRGGDRGNANTMNRNSYYDYNNRRNGSSYISNSGRGNTSNSKRISSSYHQHDYNNYHHSSSRSRGYLSRSSQQQQQQQHDEYRKDNVDYYNHEHDYRQSGHINDDGTPFEFRPEDFPSLPINSQSSDNKTSSQSMLANNTKATSSWNEIVSAPRHRSISPQSMPPSQDQRSDRSRSFNNKLSQSTTERKLSTKKPNLQTTIIKSPNRASKTNSHDDEQQRSLSLTNSDPPLTDNNPTDDGFIQTKHRRLKRRNKIKEEPTPFPEQSTEAESTPFAFNDESAFPTLGPYTTSSSSNRKLENDSTSDIIQQNSSSKTYQSSSSDTFSTSTQVKPQNSQQKTSIGTASNSVNSLGSKVVSTRGKEREQTKIRKPPKVTRISKKDTEENQKQPLLEVTLENQSDDKDIQNETDTTNTASVVEKEHQNSNALSSSSSNSSDTSDYDDAVDNLNDE